MVAKIQFLAQVDPLKLASVLWPEVQFYREQKDIIYSVWNNDETVVPAGHRLGKDFVTGFICLAFFLTRTPCRIITTSVDAKQLEGVLWGEIRRFLQTSTVPLEYERGGPLIVNHLHIRQWDIEKQQKVGLSYLMGRVAEKGEGMSGHHIAKTGDNIPRTLFVADEASGVDQAAFDKSSEWRHRSLIIGNPYNCENEFKWSDEGRPGSEDRGGDVPRAANDPRGGYVRKVIRITGEDSPNVKLGKAEEIAGKMISNRILIPGVLPYEDYLAQLKKWDPIKICVGIKARFYKGSSVLMYPPQWLDNSSSVARKLELEERFKGIGSSWHQRGNNPLIRRAKAGACDPGEGGDADRMGTAWFIIDEYGVLDAMEARTTDTSEINKITKHLLKKWHLPPNKFAYDRGGGGKQHADMLRAEGLDVVTIGFGESVTPDPKRRKTQVKERLDNKEDRYFYPSRRSQMYHELRLAIDPSLVESRWRSVIQSDADLIADERDEYEDSDARYERLRNGFRDSGLSNTQDVLNGIVGLAGNKNANTYDTPTTFSQRDVFGIPDRGEIFQKLRQELAPIPLLYDGEGKIRLPPKHKDRGSQTKEKSLCEIIGHSPDLADALVLAYHMLGVGEPAKPYAGNIPDMRYAGSLEGGE